MVDLAGEMGRAHEYQLIANCFDFLDSEAKVNLSTLRPNILFNLPTLFSFYSEKG